MAGKSKEILEELKAVGSAKTLDALLPPLLFVLINSLFSLDPAVFAAFSLALLLGISRLVRRQPWQYALGGLLGVIIAAGFAYLTRSAVSYFIPALVGSILLLALALVSLFVGKPLAAWASHLTRGWPLEWFWRSDIKPAYREVTIFWATLLAMRLAVQITLFRGGDAAKLAWTNTLLGWPFTVIVLILTYLYGLWRLRSLGGPGVDEFREGKEPPWRGQLRGF